MMILRLRVRVDCGTDSLDGSREIAKNTDDWQTWKLRLNQWSVRTHVWRATTLHTACQHANRKNLIT
jgi:hypothetical protein